MEVIVIPADKLHSKPWGGNAGKAIEIFLYPNKDPVEGDYRIRFATATVEQKDSSFTQYPGYIRHHRLLHGKSRFTVNGQTYNSYTERQKPLFRFYGHDRLQCTLETDNAKVFNVIHEPDIAVRDNFLAIPTGTTELPLLAPLLQARQAGCPESMIDLFYNLDNREEIKAAVEHENIEYGLAPGSALVIIRKADDPGLIVTLSAKQLSTALYHLSALIPEQND